MVVHTYNQQPPLHPNIFPLTPSLLCPNSFHRRYRHQQKSFHYKDIWSSFFLLLWFFIWVLVLIWSMFLNLLLFASPHEAAMGGPFKSSVNNSSDAAVAMAQTQVQHGDAETSECGTRQMTVVRWRGALLSVNAKHQICNRWAEEGDFIVFVMVAVACGGLGGGCGFWGFTMAMAVVMTWCTGVWERRSGIDFGGGI